MLISTVGKCARVNSAVGNCRISCQTIRPPGYPGGRIVYVVVKVAFSWTPAFASKVVSPEKVKGRRPKEPARIDCAAEDGLFFGSFAILTIRGSVDLLDLHVIAGNHSNLHLRNLAFPHILG